MTIKTFQISPEPRLINAQGTPPVTGSGKGSFSVIAGPSGTEGVFVDSNGNVIQLTREGGIDAERNTVAFAGSGVSLLKGKVGSEIQMKSLVAGANVTITASENGNEVVIASQDTGEVNTGTSEGDGLPVYIGKTGTNLRFRSIKAGANVTIQEQAGALVIAASGTGGGTTGESNYGLNLGSVGARVYAQKNGVALEFRRIVAGTGIIVNERSSDIEIVAQGGVGESNTGTNVGSGTGEVYKQKTGTVLEYRRLQAGSGITIATNTNEVVISATGGGGTGEGEANTASNLGTGIGVFAQKVGVDLQFNNIKAASGSPISVTQVGNDIVIGSSATSGEANTASNIGTGVGVFSAKSGVDLQFKSLKAGSSKVSVSQVSSDIVIDVPTVGETNTASNVGAGSGVFKAKSGADLQFKSLVAGSGVTLTSGTDTITIDASGGSASALVHRKITTTNTDDVQIIAQGSSGDVASISVVKTGNSVAISSVPAGVLIRSISVYFSGTDIGANTSMTVTYPEPTGATTMATSLLPTIMRYLGTWSPFGTNAGTVTNTSGTMSVTISGLTANNSGALKLVL